MIKELRIGNWVKRDLQPDGFQIDKYSFALFHNHQYDPIPLTEEWLVKFGFEKNGDWVQLNFSPRMGIRYYNGNSAECDIIQDDNYIAFKSGHIKHVHQLQNLYFALTQKELEITNSSKSSRGDSHI